MCIIHGRGRYISSFDIQMLADNIYYIHKYPVELVYTILRKCHLKNHR